MNQLTIIGNLTRDPETRQTASGKPVCSFTVAVNRRGGEHEADYFRVSAWEKLGDNCQQYLAKGRKVAVVGAVSVSSYEGKQGETRFSLDVQARDVEFLTPRGDDQAQKPQHTKQQSQKAGYTAIDDDDLPF